MAIKILKDKAASPRSYYPIKKQYIFTLLSLMIVNISENYKVFVIYFKWNILLNKHTFKRFYVLKREIQIEVGNWIYWIPLLGFHLLLKRNSSNIEIKKRNPFSNTVLVIYSLYTPLIDIVTICCIVKLVWILQLVTFHLISIN